jgi:DNA helicase-2/ATP-dependent DNA helicase PcrA
VRILTGSKHRLGLGDLATITRWLRMNEDDYLLAPESGIDPAAMLAATSRADEIVGLSPPVRTALVAFAARYRRLVIAAQGVSLVELCRRVLDEIGAWRDVEAMGDAARMSARLNLYRFLDLTESWSPLEGRPSLTSFLDYLRTMEDEPSEELDTARLAGEDAVTLLTIHRAKGLEWPVVYVPGTCRNNFPSRVMGAYDNPHARAESVPYEFRLDREDLPTLEAAMSKEIQTDLLRERHERQEWRIAHVAATRARSALIVTGAWWYGNPEPTVKPTPPSPLFELVADHDATELVETCVDPPERPDTLGFRSERVDAPDPVFGAGGWPAALRASRSGCAEASIASAASYPNR